MIRETMLWVSETLFYIQGGEMLIDTPWIFAWVVFWSFILASPMFYAVNIRPTKWAPLAFILIFFPGLMMATGPGIIQVQMMQECKTVEVMMFANATLHGERVEPQPITINQCRHKDNYYGDFGEWTTTGMAR